MAALDAAVAVGFSSAGSGLAAEHAKTQDKDAAVNILCGPHHVVFNKVFEKLETVVMTNSLNQLAELKPLLELTAGLRGR